MPKLSDFLSDDTGRKLSYMQKTTGTGKGGGAQGRSLKTSGSKGNPYIPDFVSIDFETTGLNSKSDSIIEVGAVKFINGEVKNTYSSLVNPGRSIPPEIIALTGIDDEKVADAPSFTEIADKIIDFIGRYYLAGHQVDFDKKFLNQELSRTGRQSVRNMLLDSAALSRIVLSNMQGYSLIQVARSLDISLENAHRALDDAMASGKIILKLVPGLNEISKDTLRMMSDFAPRSALKTILKKMPGKKGIRKEQQSLFRQEDVSAVAGDPAAAEDIDVRDVGELFSGSGSLSRILNSFGSRKCQINMSKSVAHALNSQDLLVAEAGTGTGKSLAYILPGGMWALKNNTRVLISTHTRNLQDQLFSNDLPVARKILGDSFRFTVLKGRSNYICLDRWQRLLAGEIGNFSSHERTAVLLLIRWVSETDTGDIEGQHIFNRRWFPKVWNLISADSHECRGYKCPYFSGECFLQRARRRAMNSHVVIINHALFFSDVCAQTSFLGKSHTIIFDEAHHLEQCGYNYLRTQVDTKRIQQEINVLNNLVKILDNAGLDGDAAKSAKEFKNRLKTFRKDSDLILAEIASWVSQNAGLPGDTYEYEYSEGPFESLPAVSGFRYSVNQLQDSMFDLKNEFYSPRENSGETRNDIESCLEKVSQLKADLHYLVSAVTPGHVFWIEGNRKRGWIKLCGVPLDVGDILREIWEKKEGAKIFTSATLSVAGSVDFFLSRAGLDLVESKSVNSEIYPSPFDPAQALKCAVRGGFNPDDKGYADYIGDSVIQITRKIKRNMLVLFTSKKMMGMVWDYLKTNRSFPSDITLFSQLSTPNRHVLLDNFKKSKGAVLLGTDSYWEGIDAPGETCELVVITRLPFPVPSHPLASALSRRCEEKYGESFFSYSVPRAVIKFKQGAGRLIRNASDRGALIVLDPRIVTKGYGKKFQRSVGDDFSSFSSIKDAVSGIEDFFEKTLDENRIRYVPLEE